MKISMRAGWLAAAVLCAAASGPAWGQPTLTSAAIDVQLFKPGPGVSDVLNLQGSRVSERFDWHAGLFLNYASNPLVVRNPVTGAEVTRLVSSQTAFDLIGSVGLYKNLELGLHLPLQINGSEPAPFLGPNFQNGAGGLGLGDVRLIPKYRFLQRDKLGLAVSLPLVLPTGRSSAFMGGGGFGAQPRLVADYALPNDFRFLANVGFNLRNARQLLNLRVGNEIAFGVGAEVPIKIEGRDLAVLSTFNGAIGLPTTGAEEVPFELIVAARYRVMPNLALMLGAGRGITNGYGTPDFRILAGLTWTTTAPKVADVPPEPEKPVCPFGPEDLDGFQDDDACEDPDNDGDGINDDVDVCPDDAETKNNFRDADGCPDEVRPQLAPLPRVPPESDVDYDGVLDIHDRCATAPEDKDGFEDTDGCPDPDNDRDGIADDADRCPLEAETINGVKDDDGCPDKGKSKVVVRGEKIVILEKVYFATGKDTILEKSFNVLQQVSSVLKANPQIRHVRVEGHTDSQGDDASNLELSQRRANSVVSFMVTAGMDGSRLNPVGYGESVPVDDNKTAKGRENNRRVEFTIVQDEPAPIEDVGAEETDAETMNLAPDAAAQRDGGVTGTAAPDGGVDADTTNMKTPDGGTRMNDAGIMTPDGSTRMNDAGIMTPDGGTRMNDAGIMTPDGSVDTTSMKTPDGGTRMNDAGFVTPDGGTRVNDAGFVTPDGGTRVNDAGIMTPDSGTRTSTASFDGGARTNSASTSTVDGGRRTSTARDSGTPGTKRPLKLPTDGGTTQRTSGGTP